MAYPLKSNPKKHFYETRRDKIDIIVLHVTAGLQDLDMIGVDHTATQTNNYGATTSREVSWHAVADSDSVEDALPDEYTAFHVRNYNSESLGLEICNRDARWDNKSKQWVTATLRNAAKKCLEWEKKYKIPRRLLTKAQVDAGERGYTYHMFLDPERRGDPGRTFPIKLFFGLLAMLDSSSSSVTSDTQIIKAKKRPNCTDLQRAVRTGDDNKWGSETDRHFRALIEASNFGGNDFPYGVKFAQAVVGTKPDGRWGPKSIAAHKRTVMNVQKALEGMGFSVGRHNGRPMFDGIWGRSTQAAYDKARAACHI